MNATRKTTRPRGLAPWRMSGDSQAVIEAVNAVLEEYREHLPLTIRQVFYRLVAFGVVGKTERDYKALCEKMNRGRRAGRIAFNSIRDDGLTHKAGHDFDSLTEAAEYLRLVAASARFDLQCGQPRRLVLWCEATGMVPQLVKVAHEYGVSVLSSGGFDSTTAKYQQALILGSQPHTVLHIGDYDPSGESVFKSLCEDIKALAVDLGKAHGIEFLRIAAVEEQVQRLNLPTAPPKETDRRAFSGKVTVQCEAIPPDELARIVRKAITDRIDTTAYAFALEQADEWRRDLLRMFGSAA